MTKPKDNPLPNNAGWEIRFERMIRSTFFRQSVSDFRDSIQKQRKANERFERVVHAEFGRQSLEVLRND